MMGSNSAYGNNPFAQLSRVTARYQNPSPQGPTRPLARPSFPWADALRQNRIGAAAARFPLPVGIPARPALDPGFGRFTPPAPLPGHLGGYNDTNMVRGAATPAVLRRMLADRVLAQLGIMTPAARAAFGQLMNAQNG